MTNFSKLDAMADKAIADHKAGKTTPLDPQYADGKRRTRIHNTRRKLIGMLTRPQLEELASAGGMQSPWHADRATLVLTVQAKWDQHRDEIDDMINALLLLAE